MKRAEILTTHGNQILIPLTRELAPFIHIAYRNRSRIFDGAAFFRDDIDHAAHGLAAI